MRKPNRKRSVKRRTSAPIAAMKLFDSIGNEFDFCFVSADGRTVEDKAFINTLFMKDGKIDAMTVVSTGKKFRSRVGSLLTKRDR